MIIDPPRDGMGLFSRAQVTTGEFKRESNHGMGREPAIAELAVARDKVWRLS